MNLQERGELAANASPGASTANEPSAWSGRRAILLGLAVFVTLAIVHRSLLFVLPWHEHSDFAVNALQIERAMQLREIHGNYSQFGFYHPGPAFYYVYAAGELILHRWLHVVPSPHNAHAVAGLFLQCLFFTAALVIAARWIRRPLFVPLALLTVAVHLGFAGNAFINTWPPRVLLMPFLCLLVSAASVAAGRLRDLPWLALAGCFLVHGHVAQPMFVGIVATLAYGAVWWHARHASGGLRTVIRENRAAHLVSAACIALFLVPLAIDLAAGAQSNLARIVEFKAFDSGQSKPLWKALLNFAAYFGYVKKPELILQSHDDRREAIGEMVPAYFVWGGIVLTVLFLLAKTLRRRGGAERAFLLSLAGMTTIAFLLCVYWSTLHRPKSFEYHGYFYYAVLCAILFVFCALVSARVTRWPRLVGAGLCLSTLGFAWQRQYAPLHIDHGTNDIPAAVEAALRQDPFPAAPKYLIFPLDAWGEAVSTGLALKRKGLDFRADPDWGPKFDPACVFEPQPPDFDLAGVSPWRLSAAGPKDIGCPVWNGARIYFEPLPLDPHRGEIDGRSGGNLELYTLFGFASADDFGAWTIRPFAGLTFESPPVAGDVQVSIEAEPFTAGNRIPAQPMRLEVNGYEVLSCTLSARTTVTARVPLEAWNARTPVTMVFHLPQAASMHQFKMSVDDRMLGCHITKIQFRTAP